MMIRSAHRAGSGGNQLHFLLPNMEGRRKNLGMKIQSSSRSHQTSPPSLLCRLENLARQGGSCARLARFFGVAGSGPSEACQKASRSQVAPSRLSYLITRVACTQPRQPHGRQQQNLRYYGRRQRAPAGPPIQHAGAGDCHGGGGQRRGDTCAGAADAGEDRGACAVIQQRSRCKPVHAAGRPKGGLFPGQASSPSLSLRLHMIVSCCYSEKSPPPGRNNGLVARR